MKIVVIDGVEYQEISRWSEYGTACVKYASIPPKPKTIVQVVADAVGYAENKYREEFKVSCAFMDAIELRLQALEKKLEGK